MELSNHHSQERRSRSSRGVVARTFRLCSKVSLASLLLGGILALLWPEDRALPLPLALVAWSLAQWTPSVFFLTRIAHDWQEKSWRSFDDFNEKNDSSGNRYVAPLEIPVIDFGDDADLNVRKDPLAYLETTYGKDWRERPLLLRGLWNASSLQDTTRVLSVRGLSQQNMTIPYFRDARIYGALTPDDEAPIHQIMRGMQEEGRPYKIASQLFVKAHPSVLAEVAPVDIISTLFGEKRFTQDRLLGHIQSPLALLRGPLTVPLFVANGGKPSPVNEESTTSTSTDSETCQTSAGTEVTDTCESSITSSDENNDWNTTATTTTTTSRPFTGLHCEPIGNGT
jgi:hypothetical protein